jgi:hypothetical protein
MASKRKWKIRCAIAKRRAKFAERRADEILAEATRLCVEARQAADTVMIEADRRLAYSSGENLALQAALDRASREYSELKNRGQEPPVSE